MKKLFFVAALSAVFVVFPASAGAESSEGSRFQEAVRGERGVIATESPAASEVGLSVLDEGGNAMDAAVASTFALNVARPQSCGIGGGGFMVYRGADGEVAALDFRETAPAAIEADAFDGEGIYTAFTGHKSVGVPGTVAGMEAALERYGTNELGEAISPAEQMAREGVEVQPSLSEEMAANAERLKLFPAASEQFLLDGEAYPAGSELVQPELADSLEMISEGGPEAFYEGPIARQIVRDMEQAGEYPGDEGLMSAGDLAAYEPVWREPLVGDYRGREVIAMPPPTSGGIATLEMLNILEGFDLASSGAFSADTLHLIAEAEKVAFADRNEYVADPDAVEVPTEELVSQEYADERRAEIDRQEAGSYEPGELEATGGEAGSDNNPDASTTQVSVIDERGNSVSLTCTIEQSFGSGVVAPGTGFLLNNELTDFSEPGTANEPAPGKRPRSSISPTIVSEDGEPRLVVGGAGGVSIIMGSLLAVTNVVDFGMPIDRAIDAPRLDEQEDPEMVLENGRISPVTQAELTGRGHEISPEGEYADIPRVQAAGVDPATGERLAVTDPRSGEEEYAALAQTGVAASVTGSGEGLPETGGVPGVSLLFAGSLALISTGVLAVRAVFVRRRGS